LRCSRTPRDRGRRCPAPRSPGPRSRRAVGSAALRGTACRSCQPLRLEVVRVLREVLGAALGDYDEVLETATAPATPVEARLERHDIAGEQPLARARGARLCARAQA